MREKYKILFVAEELSRNGAMKSLIALLKALNPEKYSLSLFLFRHNKDDLSVQLPDYVDVLPELKTYRMIRLSLKEALSESLKTGHVDLAGFRLMVACQRYIMAGFSLWPFLPKIPGTYDLVCSYVDGFVAPLILKKVKARKTACWIHYLYSHVAQPKYVYDALRKCSVCVPVSIEAGKSIDCVLGSTVCKHIIHNITDKEECIRLADMPNEFPRKEGLLRIVSTGRVTDAKHFDIIPETALLLKNRGLKFEWVIAGSGDKLAEIKEKVSQLNLNTEVKIVGELINPLPLVKSADIIINPSRHESWGMTVSEALCLGKAVVTSNIPVFAEQIVDGENGLMREATPAVMAQAIYEIAVDEELRKKLENNAIKYPFSKTMVVNEFDALVESLIKSSE